VTKHLEILRAFVESGEELKLTLPGQGAFVAGVIESLDSDVVTVVLAGDQRLVLHYSAVAIWRS